VKYWYGRHGSDTHIVGNRILSMALEKRGYKVITLGCLTPAVEFIKARGKPNADAIMVSSLYGQASSTAAAFRDLCVEAGLIRSYSTLAASRRRQDALARG